MQNKKGFTLVELIVVITILAILGTIAFISLQGYSSESRDSKRISDLGQIRTGLQIEQAREGMVPMPTEAISVGSGTTTYTNQGYAGTGVLNTLRVSDNAKDPSDDNYYTYTTNSNQTRFQLVSMLENGETVSKTNNIIIPKIYANYENRIAYTIGDLLGTLLQTTTNTPVHQLESATDIDLSGDTTEYIPVFKRGDNETSSGAELVTRLEESTNNSGGETGGSEPETTTLPNAYNETRNSCETTTVTVGSYEIASCNVGATSTSVSSTDSHGYLFQWGNSNPSNYNDGSATSSTRLDSSSCAPNNCDTGSFITHGTSPYDWSDPQNNALWGGDEPNVASPTSGSKIKKRGVCPEGFHVPTKQEWSAVVSELNVGSNGNALRDSILNLPMAGTRDRSTGDYNNQGVNGYYWSSSTSGDYAHNLYFNSSFISPSYSNYRAFGFSVRCFKN